MRNLPTPGLLEVIPDMLSAPAGLLDDPVEYLDGFFLSLLRHQTFCRNG